MNNVRLTSTFQCEHATSARHSGHANTQKKKPQSFGRELGSKLVSGELFRSTRAAPAVGM